MGIIFSVGAFILVTVILLLMQLKPSLFMLFYHSVYGRTSKKNVNHLSLYYIFGAMTTTSVLVAVCFFLTFDSSLIRWVLAGLVLAAGILFCLFYFQRGRNTKLFLNRKLANSLTKNAQSVKKPSDAFMLGSMAELPELIFTLPLYVVLALGLGGIEDAIARTSLGIIVVLASVISVMIVWGFYKSGRNLANIQRFRVKNKQFLRFFITGCYLILMALLIASEILK